MCWLLVATAYWSSSAALGRGATNPCAPLPACSPPCPARRPGVRGRTTLCSWATCLPTGLLATSRLSLRRWGAAGRERLPLGLLAWGRQQRGAASTKPVAQHLVPWGAGCPNALPHTLSLPLPGLLNPWLRCWPCAAAAAAGPAAVLLGAQRARAGVAVLWLCGAGDAPGGRGAAGVGAGAAAGEWGLLLWSLSLVTCQAGDVAGAGGGGPALGRAKRRTHGPRQGTERRG